MTGMGRLRAALGRLPAPVLGAMAALVQSCAVTGIEAPWHGVDWPETVLRTALWAAIWTFLVWRYRTRSAQPGVRRADLAVRRGSLPSGIPAGELRSGLWHVRREVVLTRRLVVGVFGAVSAVSVLLSAAAGLGGTGWVLALGFATLAVVCAGVVTLRLRRVDRLLAEVGERPVS